MYSCVSGSSSKRGTEPARIVSTLSKRDLETLQKPQCISAGLSHPPRTDRQRGNILQTAAKQCWESAAVPPADSAPLAVICPETGGEILAWGRIPEAKGKNLVEGRNSPVRGRTGSSHGDVGLRAFWQHSSTARARGELGEQKSSCPAREVGSQTSPQGSRTTWGINESGERVTKTSCARGPWPPEKLTIAEVTSGAEQSCLYFVRCLVHCAHGLAPALPLGGCDREGGSSRDADL